MVQFMLSYSSRGGISVVNLFLDSLPLFYTRVQLFAGWASRVYFSDNGSTAIEIALKMAFRKFSFDHGIHDAQECNAEGQRTELMVSWELNVYAKYTQIAIIFILRHLLACSKHLDGPPSLSVAKITFV